jgi:negative regulator of replication initiation
MKPWQAHVYEAMSKTLEIPDALYEALERQAEHAHVSLPELVRRRLVSENGTRPSSADAHSVPEGEEHHASDVARRDAMVLEAMQAHMREVNRTLTQEETFHYLAMLDPVDLGDSSVEIVRELRDADDPRDLP